MLFAIMLIIAGLALLLWSADRFVEGAAATARHLGMAPLLIGMIIVGFGTSAPELMVSSLAAMVGNPGLALGNALGSNTTNIALILGLTALICPIVVQSKILRQELPILIGITAIAGYFLHDAALSRVEGVLLLLLFGSVVTWVIRQGLCQRADAFAEEIEQELVVHAMPFGRAIAWTIIGLLLLLVSSRMLVWGAVDLAHACGISDLLIGLTVVAIGTSLPELAASIIATRKGEHDIALGNVIGSNLFNTLAAVGIAGVIRPMHFGSEIFSRDMLVVGGLTVLLFLFAYLPRRESRINRIEGAILLACYLAYTTYLVATALSVGKP